ncbi:PREDICTED: uncharacterized protein LOC109242975 [Nicotiana attenuata]|uniref:uncharacterized protein LOC109242975 n=1 Tax=Nicotiana attenuata TaxID=49451 RepID=UPI00090517E5|nr:PREDICTED: uncharacterized protein LOC109242975 [Nicotiana attenuata]
MEYLSRNLASLEMDKEFKYHPRCSKLRLYTLVLLLFARGDLKLQANLSTSEANFGGVTLDHRQQIFQYLGLSAGELPFKYLGVPLSTKKLSVPLIEKMTAKITSWTAKTLCYAGRIQLVQSVLFGIQVFWAQLFVIPTKVIKLIEGLCRSYIWLEVNEITKKALVLGIKSAYPKSSGMEELNVQQCSTTKSKIHNVANAAWKVADL